MNEGELDVSILFKSTKAETVRCDSFTEHWSLPSRVPLNQVSMLFESMKAETIRCDSFTEPVLVRCQTSSEPRFDIIIIYEGRNSTL